MNHKNVAEREKYISLFIQFSSIINCTLPEIKEKYESYAHCVTSYFEKGKEDRIIEICFDDEDEVTISCSFYKGACVCIFFFLNTDETMQKVMGYLNEVYKYDFEKTQWIASNFCVGIKEFPRNYNQSCFMITANDNFSLSDIRRQP